MRAVLKLHEPSCRKDLQRILGINNYLRKFIPNLYKIVAPLRKLFKATVCFDWLPIHTKARNELKDKASKAPVLGTFDYSKRITLEYDSIKSGLGCLLQYNKSASFIFPNILRY